MLPYTEKGSRVVANNGEEFRIHVLISWEMGAHFACPSRRFYRQMITRNPPRTDTLSPPSIILAPTATPCALFILRDSLSSGIGKRGSDLDIDAPQATRAVGRVPGILDARYQEPGLPHQHRSNHPFPPFMFNQREGIFMFLYAILYNR